MKAQSFMLLIGNFVDTVLKFGSISRGTKNNLHINAWSLLRGCSQHALNATPRERSTGLCLAQDAPETRAEYVKYGVPAPRS